MAYIFEGGRSKSLKNERIKWNILYFLIFIFIEI